MKATLPPFIFIDACGWEIIRNDPFDRSMAPRRKRLASVFGYSSARVPSILSGGWPEDHRNLCCFVCHPTDPQSYAALLTNQPEIPEDIVAIPDSFRLMTLDAADAKAANGKPSVLSNESGKQPRSTSAKPLAGQPTSRA